MIARFVLPDGETALLEIAEGKGRAEIRYREVGFADVLFDGAITEGTASLAREGPDETVRGRFSFTASQDGRDVELDGVIGPIIDYAPPVMTTPPPDTTTPTPAPTPSPTPVPVPDPRPLPRSPTPSPDPEPNPDPYVNSGGCDGPSEPAPSSAGSSCDGGDSGSSCDGGDAGGGGCEGDTSGAAGGCDCEGDITLASRRSPYAPLRSMLQLGWPIAVAGVFNRRMRRKRKKQSVNSG